MMQNIKPYGVYGLSYDPEQDVIYYYGTPVRAFVDIKERFPEGGFSLQFGYTGDGGEDDLFLSAVRNADGQLTGIEKMSESLKKELYGDADWTNVPDVPDKEEESIKNIPHQRGVNVIVFDATTYIEQGSIVAADKFDPGDIPQNILDWIATCPQSDVVSVNKTIVNGTLEAWVYYNSNNRLGWNLTADGTTLKLNLIPANDVIRGATIIRYQAPAAYNKLEVYQGDVQLTVNEK